MKITFTYLKTTLLLLIAIALSSNSFAQTYGVYLCNTGTATIVPAGIVAGDQIVWEDTYGGNTTVLATTTFASPNFVTPTNLGTGEHSITARIQSAAGCLGDPSDAVVIYKLPTITVALNDPSLASYCTNASPAPSSTILAESTPATTLPSGVTLNYTWSVSTDNGSTYAAAGSTVGSGASSSNTLTNTFTMTTTTVATYLFKVAVNYKVPSTSVLKDNGGCSFDSGTKQVVVSPVPTKPTITIQ